MAEIKKYSQELLDYAKELKYAETSEDAKLATLFASNKAKKEYMALSWKERKELLNKV